ncbi:hypothetical protein CKK33_18710 [Mucilaginibacter sp. MD40]|uniref:lantibiotic dehydratase n=1 Tax=Mucilaginibacter sp. MD40 TaxID=2029590 RepID=UPI000BACE5E1|nr:lantibiotic dehydratase [Mucilaginibacter sp. MD40]PAW95421.1 hypothetical protein CKK33_18710 [Mucilaginibacter sp. MD40]
MNDYDFLNDLLLRCPLYDYDQYSPDQRAKILLDSYFQVALYLASPQLFEIVAAKGFDFKALNSRERLSFMRYYNRMSFRPTPFGSFSSFSMAVWGGAAAIILGNKKDAKLHLNIDQEVTLRLSEGLMGNKKEDYTYICNPALYKSGKDFRFIKTSYSQNKKNIFFDLESIEGNTLTNALFGYCAGEIKQGKEIISYMVKKTGCDWETASDYLNFLIDANIVIPHTNTNIIGEDYLQRLLHHPETPLTAIRQDLSAIQDQLIAYNFPDASQLVKISGQVNNLLFSLKHEIEKQVFYAGLERKAVNGNLSIQRQQQIKEGLRVLELLVTPVQTSLLQQFIYDFKARYDLRKVLLLEAVDPEIGIGYGPLVSTAAETDLLRHVKFADQQNKKVNLEWSMVHRLLFKKWNENFKSTAPIQLNDSDLSQLSPDQTFTSPPTLPVVFRVLGDHIYLETIGGASATALIGRFTAWSNKVHELGRELASKEQLANPNVIFADIGQLSDTHADNINRRQHIYDYEIPINSISTFPVEQQIALSDLWISVVGNELVLESKSHDRVIVPRLTSAYNFSRNNLALFRLLCDLQYQGLNGNYSFDLEQYFPGMAHYPRVVYKNTILSAAKWYLSAQNLKELKEAAESEAIIRFKIMRETLQLPSLIALSQFDQQLIFNIDKENEIVFLLDCLKSMVTAVFQEFFLPAEPIVTSEGKPLVNQFIAFLYKNQEVYKGNRIPDVMIRPKVQQDYILGGKWLYLKLYCAPAIANDLLVKKLLPLLNQLGETELLLWFFIRYRDSGYHIRLRLKINESAVGNILARLKKRLADTVHYHLIREYQADTYRREMERYGPDIITLVESFFCGSSELVLRYIRIATLKSLPYSYHSLAFVSVACLLNCFIPEINDQLIFLEQMVNTFYAEFSTDKSLKIDLDQKFRELKTEISSLLTNEEYYLSLKLTVWANLYKMRIDALQKKTIPFPTKRRNQLLADLIHMHLNRLFIDRQRNQELIIYYCFYKYQLSVKAKKKMSG